ncbi:MAG: glycoside hydrolase family 3 N-terminal domain-containing protein, partial [Cellulomonadaceae bacterium]
MALAHDSASRRTRTTLGARGRLRRLTVAVTALAVAALGLAVPAQSAPEDAGLSDLALDAVATASQSQDDTDGAFPAENAVDGDPATRWASGNGPDEDVEWAQWFQLDLGGQADLDSLRLVWEASYASAYTVSIASANPEDDASWTLVHTETSGQGGTEVLTLPDGARGQYVRLDMTRRGASTWDAPTLHYYGYSLFAVEAWGTPDDVRVSFDRARTVTTGGTEVTVPLRLNTARTEDTTVHVASADGTATAGEDYTAVDRTVTVPAGQTSAAVTVETSPLGALAGNRDFTLTLSDPSDGVSLGTVSTHTVTLEGDAQPPSSGRTIAVDDFETAITVFGWGNDDTASPTLSRVPAGWPDAPSGAQALRAVVGGVPDGGWSGFSHDFTSAQDWSVAGAFTFWFHGTGSGDTLRYELKSGGASAGGATLFEASFADAAAGWHQVTVPFSALRKKNDADAPDRLDPRTVWGYAVTLSDLGAGTWEFDDFAIVERAAVVDDFEGDVPLTTDANPTGVFAWGQHETDKPTLEVTADTRDGAAPEGNHVLSGTYHVADGSWGGVSHNLAQRQDWSSYGGIRFWWYASQDNRPASPTAGADIAVEIKDGGPHGEQAELWRVTFKDNWSPDGSRWKLVELPFTSFTPSGYQPGDQATQDGVLTLERAWGWSITMPPGTPATGYRIDDVEVYGSARGAAAVALTATPEVVLVDAGQSATVTVVASTNDGEPLTEDVVVAYATGEDGTAVPTTDFTPTQGELTFPEGAESGTAQTFEVATAVATQAAEAKTVPLTLTSDQGEVGGNARIVINAQGLAYLDPALSPQERAADLLSRMTLEEKIGQMTQAERLGLSSASDVADLGLGSVLSGGGSVPADNTPHGWADMVDGYQGEALSTRLQIPLIYGIDAVHGHNNVVGATLFPHNIGLGSTRNPALVQEAGRVTAAEVRATGIPWTFSPAVSVVRDDRWGRSYEAFGEDPDLVTAFARGAVVGLQGTDPNDMSASDEVLATVKHWVGDGGTTFDPTVTGSAYPIDQGVTNVASLDELRRLHIAPYLPAIEAGVGSLMPSYSGVSVDGGEVLRMHEHTELNTTVLKEELGFAGFLISDWEGIDKLPGGTYAEKVVRSVNSGLDMAMAPYNYRQFIDAVHAAHDAGTIAIERIDDAVTRILVQKFALGLFEAPFADRTHTDDVGSAEHRAVARQLAAQSQVLLKNDGALPLSAEQRIYVAGSAADDLGRQLGGWSISWQGSPGRTTEGTSIGEAIVAAGQHVTLSPDGSADTAGHDVGVVVVGELPYAEGIGDVRNSPDSQFRMDLSAADQATIDEVCSAIETCVVLIVSGRPQVVTDQLDQMDALVASWLPGTEGAGVADVLFGEQPFTGRLPVSWPAAADGEPVNVGDAEYAPAFAYGWGLRTDTQRPRLEALRTELADGAAARALDRVLDAPIWSETVSDAATAWPL